MLSTFSASVRDGLSNLAASLGAGKDKAASDAFVARDLSRAEIEAMYRGDWLARKVVDIVPSDMCRAWRQWSGHRADVARMEAAERRLGLRRAVQRAMVLGRLYGGSAIVIGTAESDPAALARPLDLFDIRPGDLRFLHVVSRWQLGTPGLDRDPLSPWYGEASAYEVVAPGRGALVLHPSRVVRFLGNPWPDPSVAPTPWSDPVLQALYDAVHAVALTMAGATSLMHEAKVDVVTVPNLSEHLSSAETTAQLSARFGYAAAMKSINNLLLLGDGETWNRQKVDFAGLPEMVRTFLQVAAGAADIPVTRLLGQSPAGLSATGESDTRNYYDMIAARQELELRPALERLDRVIAASEGIDPGALDFAFRPLWQLDAATAATIVLQKAQATQVYAGLKLWPAATMARLVEAQLAEDGTYPNAGAVFGEGALTAASPILDFDPDQPRDWHGRWTAGEKSPDGTEEPLRPHVGLTAESTPIARPPATPTPASADPPAAADPGPHAPDGTPIVLAGFKPRSRALAKGIGALLGAAARLIRRWRSEEPEKTDPTLSKVDTTPLDPISGVQTEKNKLAQSKDPRIRLDLADTWIKDDGSLKWPETDNGADGPETPLTLQPGQIVDRYGYLDGEYLSPQGTPFESRSLPYDISRAPLHTFVVKKSFEVQAGRIAP